MSELTRVLNEAKAEQQEREQPNVRLDPVLTWTLVFVGVCAGAALIIRAIRTNPTK